MGWLLGMWLTGPCLLVCRFCATASRCVITVWCCIRTKRIDVLPPFARRVNCDLRHITKGSRTGYGGITHRLHLRKRFDFLRI